MSSAALGNLLGPAGTATVQAIGWALVHFLWQGALVALVLELGLALLGESTSRVRYALRCMALAVMGLLPVATFSYLRSTAVDIDLPAAVLGDPHSLRAVLEAAERATQVGPMGWLVAGWALGAAACAARLLSGWLRIRRLHAQSAGRTLPIEWQTRFDRLAQRMGVRAVARVIDSAVLAAPTVIGWLRPVVLIPARALTGLSAAQLEAVLAHELAHVRRHDYLVNLLQSALEALLFYHPAVWWVSHGIRAEREFCCDDAALSLSSDGVVYARALATLEGWRSVQPELGVSTLGGPLMTRIQRLIGIRPSSRPARTPLTALGALLALGCATAWAHGQPEPEPPQDPERIEAIRKHLDAVQAQLDELRSMLDEASNEFVELPESSGGNAFVLRADGGELIESDSVPRILGKVLTTNGDDVVVWESEDEELEFDGGEHGVVVLRGGDGERRIRITGPAVEVEVEGDVDATGPGLPSKLRKHAIESGQGRFNIVVRTDEDENEQTARVIELKELLGKHSKAAADQKAKVGAKLKQLHAEHGAKLEKLHAHLKQLEQRHEGGLEKLHDHLKQRLHGKDHDLSALHEKLRNLHFGGEGQDSAHETPTGEAEVEILIQRDGEPAQRIRKRIPLGSEAGAKGKALKLLFKGEGEEGFETIELDGDAFDWQDDLNFDFDFDFDLGDLGHGFLLRSKGSEGGSDCCKESCEGEGVVRLRKAQPMGLKLQSSTQDGDVRVLRLTAPEGGTTKLLELVPGIELDGALELDDVRIQRIELPQCESKPAEECQPKPATTGQAAEIV